mmetsp:Transcript_28280/g.54970  ORF Transcript_28280/g.54970 Transcript_28280/m.54970 type:complete len:176 (+) Transcript_28280:69-596(+)
MKFMSTLIVACSLTTLTLASYSHKNNYNPRCFAALSTPEQEIVPGPNGTFVVPEVRSNGFSEGVLRFDKGLTKAYVDVQVKNLNGTLDRVHIHCAPAGVGGGLAVDVFPGTLDADLNSGIVRGYLTNMDILANCPNINNIASLKAAAEDGGLYFNIHTDVFPAGELRGQLYSEEC